MSRTTAITDQPLGSVRYFVGLPLFGDWSADLDLGPLEQWPYHRVVAGDQRHLTLHYLGELPAEDLARVQKALWQVTVKPFPLVLDGLGYFDAATDASYVWAGVAPSEPLAYLRELMARTLRAAQVTYDERPFVPHVTVARTEPRLGPGVLGDLLQANVGFRREIRVEQFDLCASAWTAAGPWYRVLESYPVV